MPVSDRSVKLLLRIVLPVVMAGVVTVIAWSIVTRAAEEELWGWRPFFLLTGSWAIVLSLCLGFTWHDKSRRRRCLLSTLSGVILSLGFPPSPLTPLIFIGLVPLLMAEEDLRTQFGRAKRWKLFLLAFNTFFIWNICTTWWILNTSFLPGIVANVANTLLMSCVFVLIHQARAVIPSRLHAVALAALWITFEYIHLFWEISWPWLTFGNALAQYPSWIQWYEYTGVFGGSLWILLANFWIYRWYRQRQGRARGFALIALWICIPVAWSVWHYATYPLPEGNVEVVVVQPNFEPHYEKFSIKENVQLERFLRLSRGALTDSTDYLVFPETSFGFVLLDEIEADTWIEALRLLEKDYPGLNIVSGIESYRQFFEKVNLPAIREYRDAQGNLVMYLDVQNAAIQIRRGAEIPVYFKSKLVPGAEIFPFKQILPFLKPIVNMLQGSTAGLTTQETRDVFRSPEGNVAPVICYESVYGDYVGEYVRNGGDMIFIMTNDGWWDKTPGHVQHLLFGALRAIEHRIPIARSANTGISCFINERGEILQPTRYAETTAIRGAIAPRTMTTFYTQWGDMIARVAIFLAVLILALTLSRSLLPRRDAGVN